MKFKVIGSVWDTEQSKLLCAAVDGHVITEDERTIGILKGLGYEHDGAAEVVESENVEPTKEEIEAELEKQRLLAAGPVTTETVVDEVKEPETIIPIDKPTTTNDTKVLTPLQQEARALKVVNWHKLTDEKLIAGIEKKKTEVN